MPFRLLLLPCLNTYQKKPALEPQVCKFEPGLKHARFCKGDSDVCGEHRAEQPVSSKRDCQSTTNTESAKFNILLQIVGNSPTFPVSAEKQV